MPAPRHGAGPGCPETASCADARYLLLPAAERAFLRWARNEQRLRVKIAARSAALQGLCDGGTCYQGMPKKRPCNASEQQSTDSEWRGAVLLRQHACPRRLAACPRGQWLRELAAR